MDLEKRKQYLGGSDCASILGLSRWKSPIEIWAEKTGQIEPEDISGKLNVKLGTRLEETVAQLFSEETGKKVHRVNETIFHPQYPFLGANIDRRVVGEDALVECKTASAWLAKDWEGEEIPQEYILQVLHYLAVTGKKKAYIAVLIGNQDFKFKEIERDERIISDIIKKEVSFWNDFVVTKTMPKIVKSRDDEVLYKLYPKAVEEKEISLPDEANRIVESIEALNTDSKALDSEIRKLKNQLKAMIKDNEVGNTGIYKIKWKNIHKDEFTVKEQNYRQIFIKSIKDREDKKA